MTDRIPRLAAAGLLALALVALTGAGAGGDEGRWVGTWAASPQRTEPANMPPAPGLADATLRQVVHVSLGGRRLRVRFSNAFGAKPLTILSAHVAMPAGGRRDPGREPQAARVRRAVFGDDPARGAGGLGPGRLRPGPALRPRGDGPRQGPHGRGHRPPGGTVHLVSSGRRRGRGRPTCRSAARTPHWYYLCGVDVDAADAEAAAVAVLGDSITDGRGSPTDGNGRWTDHLARRLHDEPGDRPRRGPEPGARRQPPPERRPGPECPGTPGSRRPGPAGRALADRPGGDQRPGDALGDGPRPDRSLRADHPARATRGASRCTGRRSCPARARSTSTRSSKPHARRSTPGSASRAASTRSSISTRRPATPGNLRASRPRRTAATICTRGRGVQDHGRCGRPEAVRKVRNPTADLQGSLGPGSAVGRW